MSSLRIFLLSFFLSLGINGPTFSQTEDSLVIASPLSKEHLERNIKGSYGFLSNREPVLNQGEYAIVEKFMPFLDEDPDFALEMIEGLTANNPSLTASFDFVLGNLYYQSDRKEDAMRSYKKALDKYPDYMRAWRSIGWLSLYAENYDLALEAFGKAIKLGDTEPDTFGQIGYCYYIREDHISALSAYSQAMLYDPSNPDWLRGNLASLIALGNYPSAIVILESLTRSQPQTKEYWRTLANLYIRMDQFTKAAACLEFLRISIDFTAEEYDMLGRVYLNTASYDLAGEVYLDMITKGHSPDGDSLLVCIDALYEASLGELASQLLIQFQSDVDTLTKENQAILLLCSSKQAELAGNFLEAERLLIKGLDTGERKGDILVRLGLIQFQSGKVNTSLETLALAESYAVSRVNSLIAQGQILMNNKSYITAARKLETAIAEGAGDRALNLYQNCMHAARKQELDQISLTTGALQ
jgi:tetratricopeptide (TPR) repeat protein